MVGDDIHVGIVLHIPHIVAPLIGLREQELILCCTGVELHVAVAVHSILRADAVAPPGLLVGEGELMRISAIRPQVGIAHLPFPAVLSDAGVGDHGIEGDTLREFEVIADAHAVDRSVSE